MVRGGGAVPREPDLQCPGGEAEATGPPSCLVPLSLARGVKAPAGYGEGLPRGAEPSCLGRSLGGGAGGGPGYPGAWPREGLGQGAQGSSRRTRRRCVCPPAPGSAASAQDGASATLGGAGRQRGSWASGSGRVPGEGCGAGAGGAWRVSRCSAGCFPGSSSETRPALLGYDGPAGPGLLSPCPRETRPADPGRPGPLALEPVPPQL